MGKQKMQKQIINVRWQWKQGRFRLYISWIHVSCRSCCYKFENEIVPSRINSDIIENIICQQRSLYHGENTNPNYEYRTGINSILIGQTSTSKKFNTGGSAAKPFAFSLLPKRQRQKWHYRKVVLNILSIWNVWCLTSHVERFGVLS